MKYAVLGAGLMGKAVAYDLLNQYDTTEIILADAKQKTLEEASRFLNDSRLHTEVFNAENLDQVINIIKDVDAFVAAVHYGYNVGFTKAAIDAKTHMCDLGGNNDVVNKQLAMNNKAEKAEISIIPDCGLAPGMVSMLVKWGVEKFNWADTVKIRVGGLPNKPTGTLKYGRLFSVEGLINEYTEPVRVLRDGRIQIIEPLTELETIEFPAPYGVLEAFSTSGGTSTLVETYKNRLKNLDCKTIRYPGHCHALKVLHELGFFSNEPIIINSKNVKPRQMTSAMIEKNIPLCDDDVTLVRITFEGSSNHHELTIIDKATKNPPMTAMMRTTAFPAAIISRMQAHGQITKMGVNPQERCVPTDKFIEELKKREININGL
jgi:lysine 6-dehydrogenase